MDKFADNSRTFTLSEATLHSSLFTLHFDRRAKYLSSSIPHDLVYLQTESQKVGKIVFLWKVN